MSRLFKGWPGIVLALVLVFALLGLSYYLAAQVFFGPSAAVRTALQSDAAVMVDFEQENTWLVFTPLDQPLKAGLILYPEGYQDVRTYAPLSQQVARGGYLVVLLSRREKFALALEAEQQRVAAVMAAYPQVPAWFLGAHTWEAGLAAALANRQPDRFAGLVLWAGRLGAESSLAGSALPVLEVYGTRDDENENLVFLNQPFLPPQAVWVAIEGGNRVNFANFGPMPRDVGATISIQAQQNQAAAATLQFMDAVLAGE